MGLEEILRSGPFRTSRQCQRLLRYIVEQSLDGHPDALRERVIGMEVFDRKADYDPGQDPVVRIRASDIRKRLAQFYQSADGAGQPIFIDVPSGSYRATFRWHAPLWPGSDEPAATPHEDSTAPAPLSIAASPATATPTGSRKRFVHLWIWFIAVVAMVAAAVVPFATRVHHAPPPTSFDQFWTPFRSNPHPLLVCLGTNAVYRLSENYTARYRRVHREDDDGAERFLDLPPHAQLDTTDLVPMPDTFVGTADVSAATGIIALLAQGGNQYQERFSGDMSFADLRNVSAILVGGFNNRWTLEMTNDLRFRLAHGDSIADTRGKQIWSMTRDKTGNAVDDYALISRLVDSKTGAPLLVVAGIGTFGTQAAGEFVTSRSALREFAKRAPHGWADKNVQVVLRVRVVDYAPSTTEIVATEVW